MGTRFSPHAALGAVLATIAVSAWLTAGASRVGTPSRRASDYFPPSVRADLAAAVRAVVPEGWSVRDPVVGCTPGDWHSFDDEAGVLVEAYGGDDWLRVYFLPADWIAIRALKNESCQTCYWQGVLKNERCTIVTHASRDEYHHRCERLLHASIPSLTGGGWRLAERVFGSRAARADRTAAELVRRYCRSGPELVEAARSLFLLGVPSRTVMLRAAREADPRELAHQFAMDCIYFALGDIGDPECIGLLIDRLRRTPDTDIVYALARKRDPRVGPALQAALREARDGEAVATIAREIGYQRYRPAAADLLAVFRRDTGSYAADSIAHALAALRYREAVPAIERACAGHPPDGPGCARDGSLRLALVRLTGDWGVPSPDERVHIEGPARARVGNPVVLRIFVEVIGDEPIWSWFPSQVERGLQIDGKTLPVSDKMLYAGGLRAEYRPGSVMAHTYDLGPYLRRPGTYQVRYGDGKTVLSSNAVTVEMLP